MLDKEGQPHLMDFGLARFEGAAGEKLTQDGTILGTPAYMAPEQAAASGTRDHRASDQYSLGVTLYELLTGKTPFSGPPEIVIFNLAHRDPPAPRTLKPEVPPELETICLKAMAKVPSDATGHARSWPTTSAAGCGRNRSGPVAWGRPRSFAAGSGATGWPRDLRRASSSDSSPSLAGSSPVEPSGSTYPPRCRQNQLSPSIPQQRRGRSRSPATRKDPQRRASPTVAIPAATWPNPQNQGPAPPRRRRSRPPGYPG